MKSTRVEVEAWHTTDGDLFYVESEARYHQDKLDFYEKCFNDFNLNEAGVKDFLEENKEIILEILLGRTNDA